MSKLARAVAAAVCSMGVAGAAQAADYVVVANGNGFDGKLAQRVAAAGGTVVARLPQIGVALVRADDDGFATRASAIAGIRSVNQDVVLQFAGPELVGPAVEAEAAAPPFTGNDDRFFDLQWGHAAIGTTDAWAAGHRGAGAVVAVLDSGVACVHPDIAPNLLSAVSFVPDEGGCIQSTAFSHGSHVAGIIAAPDNGIGTIGVAPEAKLIGVKVLSEVTGSGSFGGIMQGIVYAADQGADVINMSLGVRGGLPVGGPAVAELINATARATRYARSQGALVVASAGNDGFDLDHMSGLFETEDGNETYNIRAFPAELPGVVTVSATAPVGWALDPAGSFLDHLASYSNYGQSAIDFAAPGGDAVYPGNEACVVAGILQPCWVFDLSFSVRGYAISGGVLVANYTWTAGTSMAAPHVSGVAALIIGANGGEMDPAAVERALRQGATDLGKPGNDDAYGAGRVYAPDSL